MDMCDLPMGMSSNRSDAEEVGISQSIFLPVGDMFTSL